MRIEVTPDDIGEQCRCGWNCPISRAIQRATGKPETDVFVGDGWVEIDYGRVTERVKLPKSARRWIRDYDSNGRVGVPFAFELDV